VEGQLLRGSLARFAEMPAPPVNVVPEAHRTAARKRLRLQMRTSSLCLHSVRVLGRNLALGGEYAIVIMYDANCTSVY
jgi:hypothetical protein